MVRSYWPPNGHLPNQKSEGWKDTPFPGSAPASPESSSRLTEMQNTGTRQSKPQCLASKPEERTCKEAEDDAQERDQPPQSSPELMQVSQPVSTGGHRGSFEAWIPYPQSQVESR